VFRIKISYALMYLWCAIMIVGLYLLNTRTLSVLLFDLYE